MQFLHTEYKYKDKPFINISSVKKTLIIQSIVINLLQDFKPQLV